MMVDLAPAFENGNSGATFYRSNGGFMASVKTGQGGFSIGYGGSITEALSNALNPRRHLVPAAKTPVGFEDLL